MSGPTAAISPVAEIEPVVIDPAIAADPVVAPTDANAADPSTVDEQDAKEPGSLLDVIKSAIEKPVEAVASSDPEGDPVEPKVEEPAVVVEPKAEDDADLPFHNHPRWKAVIAERDAFKEPAESFGLIQGFMQEHGLNNEEVAEGYEIMALLKSGDPEKLTKAREWFHDRLTALDESLGNSLPEDLQARVDEGLLDEDGASELARARAATALRATQETARTEAATAATKATEATAVTTQMVGAVQAWEDRIKASDPDYSMKADLVQAKCQAIVLRTGKPPTTAAEATALTDLALAEVNTMLKSSLPKPRPVNPAPKSSSAAPAAPAATSLRAAIDAAVNR